MNKEKSKHKILNTKRSKGITLIALIITILVLLAGAFIGNYVQQNKEEVKDRVKKFIDKM